jgi:hypothetical protein
MACHGLSRGDGRARVAPAARQAARRSVRLSELKWRASSSSYHSRPPFFWWGPAYSETRRAKARKLFHFWLSGVLRGPQPRLQAPQYLTALRRYAALTPL